MYKIIFEYTNGGEHTSTRCDGVPWLEGEYIKYRRGVKEPELCNELWSIPVKEVKSVTVIEGGGRKVTHFNRPLMLIRRLPVSKFLCGANYNYWTL